MIGREPLEASLLDVKTDAENARRVEERIGWRIEQLIDELAEEGEHVQDLLSQLSEDDRDYRGGDFPMTLGDFVRIVEHERHDIEHLEQLRAATEGERTS